MKKTRLDVALVERGLAASRERARALIMAGQVRVDGQVTSKAGANVGVESVVEVAVPDHPYVGRGGVKLAHVSTRISSELPMRERGRNSQRHTHSYTRCWLYCNLLTRKSTVLYSIQLYSITR